MKTHAKTRRPSCFLLSFAPMAPLRDKNHSLFLTFIFFKLSQNVFPAVGKKIGRNEILYGQNQATGPG
jgi:hypothetical protein